MGIGVCSGTAQEKKRVIEYTCGWLKRGIPVARRPQNECSFAFYLTQPRIVCALLAVTSSGCYLPIESRVGVHAIGALRAGGWGRRAATRWRFGSFSRHLQ